MYLSETYQTHKRDKAILIGIGIILLIVICGFALISVSGYHTATGYLVSYSYVPGSGSSVSTGIIDGEPAVIQSSGTSEQYILVIETNGATASYTVSGNTYTKAVNGQSTFKMGCTATGCTILE